ncbi:MAG: DUF4276 family protein [Deltaproteobacteria bacterium]|nr:DUF4276 family protein [Deltaproteobacteria bacterium]
MSSIKIFVEGGGDTNASGRAELRVAFDTLIGAQKDAARKKRMKWDTVFCGGRNETAAEFANALKRKDADFVVLVVDAEDEVSSATPSRPTAVERVKHLEKRDGIERLTGASAEQVHLMTRCMEAWVFADGEKVAEFYGKDFNANALPKRAVLDEEPKPTLYAAIEKATKDTKKGSYGKVKHGSALLKAVRPAKVAERCVSFQQFTQWLDAAIGGA